MVILQILKFLHFHGFLGWVGFHRVDLVLSIQSNRSCLYLIHRIIVQLLNITIQLLLLVIILLARGPFYVRIILQVYVAIVIGF